MKHYTCDKCGMPMEGSNTVTIDNTKYDMCPQCYKQIVQGLEGKGERTTIQQYYAQGLQNISPYNPFKL